MSVTWFEDEKYNLWMMLLRILAHLLKRVLSHDVDGRRQECRIVMYTGWLLWAYPWGQVGWQISGELEGRDTSLSHLMPVNWISLSHCPQEHTLCPFQMWRWRFDLRLWGTRVSSQLPPWSKLQGNSVTSCTPGLAGGCDKSWSLRALALWNIVTSPE